MRGHEAGLAKCINTFGIGDASAVEGDGRKTRIA